MALRTIDDEQDDVSYLVNLARDAFGHLVQGISVFDHNLQLVFFNDRFTELLDFPRGLVREGTNLEVLFRYNAERGEYGPGDIEAQVRSRVALAKQFTAHSFTRTRPNGEIIQIDGSPMPSGGFVTTYTDITEKVRYEEFLKSIIEASPAGFSVSRQSDGKISFINTRLARMFGIPVREMIGYQARDLYADPGQRDLILEQTAAQGQTTDFETRFKHRDGSEFPALVSLYPTLYDNEPSFFAWIYEISNLKQAQQVQAELERELHHAQKLEAIGHLAAGIAHEINTPSQYILDNLRFLMQAQEDLTGLLKRCLPLIDQLPSQKEQQMEIARQCEEIDLNYLLEDVPEAITQSVRGISDITRIVQAMKAFSQPGEGHKTAIDINQLLENTLTVSRSEWKPFARTETRFDTTLPKIICNPGELGQVFLNLLVNAAHAIQERDSSEEGTIRIVTRQQDDRVVIEVADNGTGIPASVQNKVFDPFFTTREVGKGTGQGLSFAHHVVVKKHAGEIGFSSEPGAGTTFTVTLPFL